MEGKEVEVMTTGAEIKKISRLQDLRTESEKSRTNHRFCNEKSEKCVTVSVWTRMFVAQDKCKVMPE